eukprot:CAMPEP_0203673602 /NCGR_PEP_ID=MMETSP0090-20130426/13180_1 /ASSEMBLY_ACC=CAM_ASM_001088 /TAXON_ID=426623 /ORGANISM="Chaetoceros affinis, Strain CCMP159" /LENGTH=169 /DNA_ID=CAMNT_0050539297 /DNA_START=52 /DNA_END=561 /DNA_ORIENTATION=-
MALGLHNSPMKRSLPSFDLSSMSSGDIDVTGSASPSNKRLSSIVFGWDHYRSCEETSSVGKEYQTWRDKKRPRRHGNESKASSSRSYKLSMRHGHAIPPICEETDHKGNININRWSTMPPLSSSDVSYSSTDSEAVQVVNMEITKSLAAQSSLLPLVKDITDELAMTVM